MDLDKKVTVTRSHTENGPRTYPETNNLRNTLDTAGGRHADGCTGNGHMEGDTYSLSHMTEIIGVRGLDLYDNPK